MDTISLYWTKSKRNAEIIRDTKENRKFGKFETASIEEHYDDSGFKTGVEIKIKVFGIFTVYRKFYRYVKP